jgi:pimeloyl-ACP methyl ester carboxylesterase
MPETPHRQTDQGYSDQYFWSHEGLRLHYRDYPGPDCGYVALPGLTRNARDFESLAPDLATYMPVWCVDLRGRGESAYAKDPLSYVPLIYLRDIERLIEAALDGRKLLVVGTSLGGILAMLMAGTMRDVLAGVVLNDIGPKIEPEGLARIRGYVGRGGAWPSWMHMARDLELNNAANHPRWTLPDWLRFAKRVCRVHTSGRIIFDYDPRISEPFKLAGGEAGVDLWPAFQALGDLPCVSLRGALSDLFAPETQREMARRLPQLTCVEIPEIGHAPTLDEPEARAAIHAWIGKLINPSQ